MFDVLVFVFEHFGAPHACPDSDALARRLTAAGFEEDDISQALAFLSGLARVTQDSFAVAPESETATRVYARVEVERLGVDAIGFLTFLEHAGQLTPTQREFAIERALTLDETPVPLGMVKVIVLMVLWSQQVDIDVLILEELLDADAERALH